MNLAFSFIKKKKDTSTPIEIKTYPTPLKNPNSIKGKAVTFTHSFVIALFSSFWSTMPCEKKP